MDFIHVLVQITCFFCKQIPDLLQRISTTSEMLARQSIRTSTASSRLENLLHNALLLIVPLPHLVVALLYLHPRPRIEVFAPQKLRPIVFVSSFHRLSDHCACQKHTVTFYQQCQFFSVRRLLRQDFPQLQRCYRPTQQVLRIHLFLAASRSHILFPNPLAFKQAKRLPRELCSPTMQDPPSLATHLWCFTLSLLLAVAIHAETHCVRLSVVLHRYRCDVVELEASLPALPVANEPGFVPFSRITYRVLDEAHLLLSLVSIHFRLAVLARFVLLRLR